jgi:hypothetical protein
MRCFLVVVGAALALAGAARASVVQTVELSPLDDVSIPFWCDWGYDWDERCYRLHETELAVGGDEDKVWRSALRFSTAAIPMSAAILSAELSLWYDGTCLAPLKTSRPCEGRGLDFALHPILSPRWDAEREVDVGPQIAFLSLAPLAAPQWLVWEVTDLVGEWASGALENDGVLIRLADSQEQFAVGGPLFPSSRHPQVEVRPKLTVRYLE